MKVEEQYKLNLMSAPLGSEALGVDHHPQAFTDVVSVFHLISLSVVFINSIFPRPAKDDGEPP